MSERRPEERIPILDDAGNKRVLIGYGLYDVVNHGMWPDRVKMKRRPLAELETEDGRPVEDMDEEKNRFLIDGVWYHRETPANGSS